jgi:hypothetical protein
LPVNWPTWLEFAAKKTPPVSCFEHVIPQVPPLTNASSLCFKDQGFSSSVSEGKAGGRDDWVTSDSCSGHWSVEIITAGCPIIENKTGVTRLSAEPVDVLWVWLRVTMHATFSTRVLLETNLLRAIPKADLGLPSTCTPIPQLP